MRPDDYGFEYGDTFDHPKHGEVTIFSTDSWPLLAETEDGEEVDIFEFHAEEVRDL